MLLRLRSHIALVLLLAFARVLVPDHVLLALHDHAHTQREAAHDDARLKGQTVVDQQHTHCAADHLFNAPALPAPAFAFGVLLLPAFPPAEGEVAVSVWAARLVPTRCLRGPPAQA